MKRAIIKTENELREFLKDFNSNVFSLDTETTSLSYKKLEITHVQLCDGNKTCVILFKPCETFIKQWFKSLSKNTLIIAHNITYDAKALYKEKINITNFTWFDTMVAYHLLNETDNYGLKYLANKFLGVDTTKYEDAKKNEEKFLEYAMNDAEWTYKLFREFAPKLKEEGLETLMKKIEMPFLRVIVMMEITGWKVDKEKIETITKELKEELFETQRQMYEMLKEPYDIQHTLEGTLHLIGRLNFNSGEHLAKILFDKLGLEDVGITNTGKRKTGREAIEKLKDKHPFVTLLKKYKIISKLLQGFFEPMPNYIDEDERIRSSFNDCGTVTGRLASSSPNFQQLPKSKKEFPIETRSCFIASKGKILIAADYSGQELRVLAQVTNDEGLINAFHSGKDFHQETADKFNVSRTIAKQTNFGIAYGKAQPLHSKVLTPFGWSTIGDIREGDVIFSANGMQTRVIKIHPIQLQPTYKLTMKDGSSTECGFNHLWTIQTHYDKQLNKFRTIPTYKLQSILKKGTNNNCFIQYNKPLFFKSQYQYIHPYIMGLYLGDGDSCNRLTIENLDIVEKVRRLLPSGYTLNKHSKYHYSIINPNKRNKKGQFIKSNKVKEYMENLGLKDKTSKDKHIPLQYLYGDYQQRVALFKGLFDSDGSFNNNSFDYTSISKKLAEDVQFLAKSLGGRATITSRIPKCNGKEGQRAYRVFISFPPIAQSNSIESIEYIGLQKCRCITIDDPSGLYITDDFIVTHNSAYGFANDWGTTEEEAQKYVDAYFKEFPKVKEAIDTTMNEVKKQGYVKSLTGRRRRFTPITDGNNTFYKRSMFREAFNFKIQGFSSDMIRIASIKIYNECLRHKEWGMRILALIHDEVVLEVNEYYADVAMDSIKKAMESAVKLKVPVIAEVNKGYTYADAK